MVSLSFDIAAIEMRIRWRCHFLALNARLMTDIAVFASSSAKSDSKPAGSTALHDVKCLASFVISDGQPAFIIEDVYAFFMDEYSA